MTAHFEIRLFTNRMVVRNVDSGQSIARVASRPFSSSRLLVGDIDAAEALLGEIVKNMDGWRRFIRPAVRASFYPMEQCEGGLCPVEVQSLCDLGLRMGFTKVDIC